MSTSDDRDDFLNEALNRMGPVPQHNDAFWVNLEQGFIDAENPAATEAASVFGDSGDTDADPTLTGVPVVVPITPMPEPVWQPEPVVFDETSVPVMANETYEESSLRRSPWVLVAAAAAVVLLAGVVGAVAINNDNNTKVADELPIEVPVVEETTTTTTAASTTTIPVDPGPAAPPEKVIDYSEQNEPTFVGTGSIAGWAPSGRAVVIADSQTLDPFGLQAFYLQPLDGRERRPGFSDTSFEFNQGASFTTSDDHIAWTDTCGGAPCGDLFFGVIRDDGTVADVVRVPLGDSMLMQMVWNEDELYVQLVSGDAAGVTNKVVDNRLTPVDAEDPMLAVMNHRLFDSSANDDAFVYVQGDSEIVRVELARPDETESLSDAVEGEIVQIDLRTDGRAVVVRTETETSIVILADGESTPATLNIPADAYNVMFSDDGSRVAYSRVLDVGEGISEVQAFVVTFGLDAVVPVKQGFDPYVDGERLVLAPAEFGGNYVQITEPGTNSDCSTAYLGFERDNIIEAVYDIALVTGADIIQDGGRVAILGRCEGSYAGLWVADQDADGIVVSSISEPLLNPSPSELLDVAWTDDNRLSALARFGGQEAYDTVEIDTATGKVTVITKPG